MLVVFLLSQLVVVVRTAQLIVFPLTSPPCLHDGRIETTLDLDVPIAVSPIMALASQGRQLLENRACIPNLLNSVLYHCCEDASCEMNK